MPYPHHQAPANGCAARMRFVVFLSEKHFVISFDVSLLSTRTSIENFAMMMTTIATFSMTKKSSPDRLLPLMATDKLTPPYLPVAVEGWCEMEGVDAIVVGCLAVPS